MAQYTLEIELCSDTTFGMGSAVSGLIDAEIHHDSLGLPRISGKTLKGLLVDACGQILDFLPKSTEWQDTAKWLFGSTGELLDDESGLAVGDATLAPDLCLALAQQKMEREQVIVGLTTIRYQTAMNEFGASMDESLRASRVLVRETKFYAPLYFQAEPGEKTKALLAACVLTLRRGGLGRSRGRGKIKSCITSRPLDPLQFAATSSDDLTLTWFKPLKEVLEK